MSWGQQAYEDEHGLFGGLVMPRDRWRAAMYLRLSRDDGDKVESNSISNQRDIIQEFIDYLPDVTIIDEFVDDGWSGSNFNRPGFNRMMAAIDKEAIDCIVVKDLSRLGRNYIEIGRYLERELPSRGVRVLAVTDGYDSMRMQDVGSQLMVPFKNLINDYYCATTSAKVKAALAVRRRAGKYVGSKAPYGFVKNADNPELLEIDASAAEVVRMIFTWRAQADGLGTIARRLNEAKIPCPAEYRRLCNSDAVVQTGGATPTRTGGAASAKTSGTAPAKTSGTTPGQTCDTTPTCTGGIASAKARDGAPAQSEESVALLGVWHAREIQRITENPCYAGVLTQGRTYSPSFRSKKRIKLPPQHWSFVEGGCPAIVDKALFELVAQINRERRGGHGKAGTNLLSGLVVCGICGTRARFAQYWNNQKRYGYYRLECGCKPSHIKKRCWYSIRDEDLLEKVCKKTHVPPDRATLVRAIAQIKLFIDKEPEIIMRSSIKPPKSVWGG